uniref:Uncharacterized protein n=1 Tax=Oryza brachyantha TaxID=4533 RepID=J3NEB6_ORYBR
MVVHDDSHCPIDLSSCRGCTCSRSRSRSLRQPHRSRQPPRRACERKKQKTSSGMERILEFGTNLKLS